MTSTPAEFDFTKKYEASGKIGGWLISNFYDAVKQALLTDARSDSTVLEVGAGDGFSTRYIRNFLPSTTTLVASEIRLEGIEAIRRQNPTVPTLCQSIYQLAHASNSVDAVVCLEVLEHLEHPERALKELCRVSSGVLILSVPREPIWRALNMARFKYWADLGNTPGHLQHWSSTGFERFVGRYCEIVSVQRPLPWTVLAARPR